MNLRALSFTIAAVLIATAHPAWADQKKPAAHKDAMSASNAAVHHRTITIDGLDIFYREAGPANAPVILLLHGFPTSSAMFRNLIPSLATRYHVIAPDYPGFGYSSMPSRDKFDYTFAHYAELMAKLTSSLKVDRYALYVMDYGAPVGYRLALKHPERVTAFIVQNGNAYDEGLRDFWKPFRVYWQERTDANAVALRKFLTLEATKWQYTHGVPDTTLVSPDTWLLDQIGLDRPGNNDVQLDLFYDYRTNVPLYPDFQAYFRKNQPPMLIVWGKNDFIFPAEGASPYLRDLPKAELHLLDAGHFALETNGAQIAGLMLQFMDRVTAASKR